jgi:hypothetical protein
VNLVRAKSLASASVEDAVESGLRNITGVHEIKIDTD